MYQPWIGYHFPAVTPATVADIRWTTYVAMWDSIKE